MPVICRFYGLLIKMFFIGSEHQPPHIHVSYGEYNALLDIRNLTLLEGDLPVRAEKMALEWAGKYQEELLEMWKTQSFRQLPPLE